MKLSDKFLNLLSNQERAELCDCNDLPFDNVVSAHCPIHGIKEEVQIIPDFPNEPWV